MKDTYFDSSTTFGQNFARAVFLPVAWIPGVNQLPMSALPVLGLVSGIVWYKLITGIRRARR